MPLQNQIKDVLKRLKEKYEDLKPTKPDEINTEDKFVIPLLDCLGYPVYSHDLVERRYLANKRKPYSKGSTDAGRVDFAIKDEVTKEPKIFIECKRLDSSLDDGPTGNTPVDQTKSYFDLNISVDFAILTNGYEYRIYSDLDNPNSLDSKPFKEFNLNNYSQDDIKILELISKGYDVEKVKKFARDSFDKRDLLTYLSENLTENPCLEFIKFLSKEVFGDRKSKNVKKTQSLLPFAIKELMFSQERAIECPKKQEICSTVPKDDAINVFDIKELSYIKPEYIIFENQKEDMTNWRDVLECLMKKLLDRDVAGISQLHAKSISTQRKWRDSRDIGHGYYIEANKSAKDILSVLKKSLSHLNLKDALYLSIRHTKTLK